MFSFILILRWKTHLSCETQVALHEAALLVSKISVFDKYHVTCLACATFTWAVILYHWVFPRRQSLSKVKRVMRYPKILPYYLGLACFILCSHNPKIEFALANMSWFSQVRDQFGTRHQRYIHRDGSACFVLPEATSSLPTYDSLVRVEHNQPTCALWYICPASCPSLHLCSRVRGQIVLLIDQEK